MARLLLVEDDETIGGVLDASLRAHGHEVTWARTGQDALRGAEQDPDLVLLDLGLPDLDGVEVCRRLRTRLPGAVLVMLTARTDEMDVVVGLEAGADDYLTKPVRLDELRARIRAHLRRGGPAPVATGTVELGALFVDVAGRRVSVDGRELVLRAKEFDLLARLAADAGTAVSRETLMNDVWDVNWFGSTKTLDMHIAALRRRLGGAGATRLPEIVTLRGHGYRLDPPT
jgi:DNA-binding response OmpR family regulator